MSVPLRAWGLFSLALRDHSQRRGFRKGISPSSGSGRTSSPAASSPPLGGVGVSSLRAGERPKDGLREASLLVRRPAFRQLSARQSRTPAGGDSPSLSLFLCPVRIIVPAIPTSRGCQTSSVDAKTLSIGGAIWLRCHHAGQRVTGMHPALDHGWKGVTLYIRNGPFPRGGLASCRGRRLPWVGGLVARLVPGWFKVAVAQRGISALAEG